MISFKKIIAAFSLLFATGFLSANTVSFETDDYKGSIIYNEKANPGQAVFARLTMKIKKGSNNETVASIQLFKDSKKIDSTKFYFLNEQGQRKNTPDMFATLPLSSWLNSKNEYYLRVIFSTQENTAKEVLLPFHIEDYEFPEEVLDLDEKNSQIRQNMSAERLLQIEKLNKLLGTFNSENIFTTAPWIKPVKSTRMTSHFADRRTYKYTNGKSETSVHYGNDYGVPEGTDVVACADGKIVMAEFRISTGWTIVIEHLPGLYSLYYHMSALEAKEGQFVKQGSLIGKSGSTGLATGPHLHWEVRLNMCPVQPEIFISDYIFENVE